MRSALLLGAVAGLLLSCGQAQAARDLARRTRGPTGRLTSIEAAVDSRPAPPASLETPVRGDTLVVAIPSDPATLNPLVEASTVASPMLRLLYPSLVDTEFHGCETTFVPRAASSWQWSDGDRTLTFRLRRDLTWTDGRPVTSEDVHASFTLMGSPATASPRASYVAEVAAIDTPDDATVVFRFRRAYDRSTQLLHTGYPFVASHVFSRADPTRLRGHPASHAPVGAGPFRLERWEKGTELVLARNDAWNLPHPPYLDRIVFRVLADPALRVAELERGAVDLVEDLTPRDVASIRRAAPAIRILDRGSRFLDFLAWNLHHPALSDPDVRRALTMALDRERILHTLLDAGGETVGRLAVSTTPPVLCQDSNDRLQPLPYDPGRARRLLAARGWRDADGDGVRERDGTRLSLTLSYDAGNPRREKTAVLVRRMLAEVGVEADLRALAAPAHFDALRRHEFDAGLFGIGAGLVVDRDPFWRSGEGSVLNVSQYANPRVDERLDAARQTLDPAARRRIGWEIDALVHDDLPWTFLFWRNQILGVDRRFHGVRADVISPLHGITSWWVPREEQRHPPRGQAPTPR